jgi:RsiW-degrading membrane proteinase PrsW (M82 family)
MAESFLAVSAVVPSLLLVWYFHRRDIYPEPAPILWATFGLGVLTALPVLAVAVIMTFLLSAIDQPFLRAILEAFLLAAGPEELFKLLVLLGFSMRSREFDEPMDGVVYGVVASLGFAAAENVLYVFFGGYGIAFLRAVTAVPMHAFLGAILGYFVGQAFVRIERPWVQYLRGYGAAVLLHGLYDAPLLVIGELKTGIPTLLLSFVTLAVLGISGWWAVNLVHRLRREQVRGRVGGEYHLADYLRRSSRLPHIIQLVAGGVMASAGGMMLLGLILAFILGEIPAGETYSIVTGGVIIGLLPTVLGTLLFLLAIRGMNRFTSAPGVRET